MNDDRLADLVVVCLTSGEYSDYSLGHVIAVPRAEWERTVARLRALESKPSKPRSLWMREDFVQERERAERNAPARAEEAARLRSVAMRGIEAYELHASYDFEVPLEGGPP